MSEGMNVRKWECSPTTSRMCGTTKGARSGWVGVETRYARMWFWSKRGDAPRVRGTRHRMGGTRSRALSRELGVSKGLKGMVGE